MDRCIRIHPTTRVFLRSLALLLLCLLLVGCDISINLGGNNSGNSPCQSNCVTGTGINGVQVYVEPDDGERVITNAIHNAQRSVWLEMYILTDTNVIHALEDAANNGLDVRVMLEPHPLGLGTSSVTRTFDELKAAGIKIQDTSPAFPLTHEKGIPIFRNVSVQF